MRYFIALGKKLIITVFAKPLLTVLYPKDKRI